MDNITIKSHLNTYSVIFFNAMNDLLEEVIKFKKVIVVMDKHIASLYPDLYKIVENHFPVLTIDASEEEKSLIGVEKVLDFFQEHNVTKSMKVVAIGGGIVQDIACFSAHIYYRGLPFIYIPTTLLAMCDSCIGAKNGLNYKGFKNQLGAFQAPEVVLICRDFLDTLPTDAIQSGYGEILKLALIEGGAQYASLKHDMSEKGLRASRIMKDIHDSLLTKKSYIEEDEFDIGQRRILNYGHTFGHALEVISDYKIAHGIAVAKGMDIVNYISFKKGYLTEQDYLDIHQSISYYFHCDYIPEISLDMLMEKVKKDKKVVQDKLNLILLKAPGELKIEPVNFDSELSEILADYFKHNPSSYRLVN